MSDHALGFTTQENEIAVDGLPVRGAIPAWLAGTLVRNGPAKFEVGDRSYRHWFDGLAMLHAFSFQNGCVSYRNRLLRSRSYNSAVESGRIRFGEFGTDPCLSLFGRVLSWFQSRTTDNANVNVSRIADQVVALTETPLPVEFEPETLETLGVFDYADRMKGQVASAHPHLDRERRLVSYTVRFSFRSEYVIYQIPPGSTKRQVVGSVKEPGYLHSFGITERYAVLAEFPLLVNPLRLKFSGRPFIENYRWKPGQPTRFFVWDRHTGEKKGIFEGEPSFAFHHVNAFEDGDRLVVDVAACNDSSVVTAFYLDRLRNSDDAIPDARLRRYRLPLNGGTVTHEVLSGRPIELPRINYRQCNGRSYRFVYGVSRSEQGRFFDQLVKADVEQRTSQVWQEDGRFPGEPVFVAAPDSRSEDDGVILSVVLDSRSRTSFLLVLHAGSFGELGRAEVPQHIPFGFHSQFFS